MAIFTVSLSRGDDASIIKSAVTSPMMNGFFLCFPYHLLSCLSLILLYSQNTKNLLRIGSDNQRNPVGRAFMSQGSYEQSPDDLLIQGIDGDVIPRFR